MLSCIHTHTRFCDGRDDVEQYCQTAWEKGFSGLGFSSHAPVTNKTALISSWHMREEDLPRYIAEVQAAKKRWEGRLPVYLGLEVDYIPGSMGPADSGYRDMGLDFIIGSVHYLKPRGGFFFTVDGPLEEMIRGAEEGYGGSGERLMEAYWDAVEEMVEEGGFDLLGHPDLVKKNNQGGRFFDEGGRRWLSRLDSLARLLSHKNICAEVNTGGMNRAGAREPYPSAQGLALFKKYGIPVTINADAHAAKELDGHYKEAREYLAAAGYRESFHFAGREHGKARWRSESV